MTIGKLMPRWAFGLSLMALCTCTKPAQDKPQAPPQLHAPTEPATSAAPTISYGGAMVDVARRFEVLGRAIASDRFELAAFELGEIGETFEDTLPHASLPREGHPEVLPAIAHTFVQTNLPDLQHALDGHDQAAINAAFVRTATACNACHQASGHAFIEVPTLAGHSVPNTDPIAP